MELKKGWHKKNGSRSFPKWQDKLLELRRRHPEHLMQNPKWQQTKESPGWKIWKYLF